MAQDLRQLVTSELASSATTVGVQGQADLVAHAITTSSLGRSAILAERRFKPASSGHDIQRWTPIGRLRKNT